MRIIEKSQTITSVSYTRSFTLKDVAGAGYGFDCDANGVVSKDLVPEAKKNFKSCTEGELSSRVIDEGVKSFTNRYTTDPVGLCDVCNKRVVLSCFANTCDCGAEYNTAGQRLSDRSFWGEETGETAADFMLLDPDDI